MGEALKPKKRTTIYVEPNIHRNFKEICEREDVSVSEKVEGFMARYVAVHMEGNPVIPLTRFMEEVKGKCFRCEGMFPNLIKVKFISGVTAPLCPECLEHDKERRIIKKILGKLGD